MRRLAKRGMARFEVIGRDADRLEARPDTFARGETQTLPLTRYLFVI
jgi:hypothetical protein